MSEMMYMCLCKEHAGRISTTYILAETDRNGKCMLPECGRDGIVYEAESKAARYSRRREQKQTAPIMRDKRARHKGHWRDF